MVSTLGKWMKYEINIACNWNSIEISMDIFSCTFQIAFTLEWLSCLYTDEQSETHDKCRKINHKFGKLNLKKKPSTS